MAGPTPEEVIAERERKLAEARRKAEEDGADGWNQPSE